MKQRNLLEHFEYKSYDSIGVINNQRSGLQVKNVLPSMEVKIAFAAGKFSLQADWQFILQHNRHSDQQYLFAYKKRVQIQMDIFPIGEIDLNDSSNNGLMLPLDGSIMDESTLNACTGMLVLKNQWYNKLDSNLWRLSFYIYDYSSEYGEINFDLPLFLVKQFQMN